jgi:uncharacterized protein (TIGR02996 family)
VASPGDALLQEILQSPDDDAPRLVYADWLEQQGDDEANARAELIRAQCAVEHASPAKQAALKLRIRAVLKRFGRRWTARVKQAKLGAAWTFRRGFLDGVTLAAEKFPKHAEEMFSLVPTLSTLRCPEASNEIAAFLACPLVARLTELNLKQMCSCGTCSIERELPLVFASERVANLTKLVVAKDRIELDNARLLAASPVLVKLRQLDLSDNRLGPEGAAALADSNLAALTELSLRGNAIASEGAAALAASTRLTGLASLDLAANRITNEGGLALAHSTGFASLTSLDLRDNKLERKATAALRKRFGRRVLL